MTPVPGSDGTEPDSDGSGRKTRRQFLATVGAATAIATAGCSVLEDDESKPRFDPDQIEAVVTSPEPEVDRPAPIRPAEDTVEDSLDRLDTLLSRVPESIDPDRVPNGVVREEIEAARGRAVEHRKGVVAATDRFRAVRNAWPARRDAREAAVALEAVDADLAAQIDDERVDVRQTARERLETLPYEGADPYRTLLLAARCERDCGNAVRRLNRGYHSDDPSVLDVGKVAGRVERGAATVSDWNHLIEQHAERASDPTDFESAFSEALEQSLATFRDADLPSPETEVSDVVDEANDHDYVRRFLAPVLRSVASAENRLADALAKQRLGTGLTITLAVEQNRRALETGIERVESGDLPPPESVDRIRDEREAILETTDELAIDPSDPSLAGDAVAARLIHLRRVDDQIRRYADQDRPSSLESPYAQYALIHAQLTNLGDAITAVRGRIDVTD